MAEATSDNGFSLAHISEKERMAALNSLRAHDDIAAFLQSQPGLPRVEVEDQLIAYNLGDWHGIHQMSAVLAGKTENLFHHELHNAPACSAWLSQ